VASIRVDGQALVVLGSTRGRTSTVAVYLNGWPASTEPFSTRGGATGSSCVLGERLVDRARDQLLRDVLLHVVAKYRSTSRRGTWPCR